MKIDLQSRFVQKHIHTFIALFGFVGAYLLIKLIGGTLFEGMDDAIDHLIHMIVFAGVGFVILLALMYAALFTILQPIVLPYADFLLDHEKRWRAHWAGEGLAPSAEECRAAAGYATNSGLRIAAYVIALALLATPL